MEEKLTEGEMMLRGIKAKRTVTGKKMNAESMHNRLSRYERWVEKRREKLYSGEDEYPTTESWMGGKEIEYCMRKQEESAKRNAPLYHEQIKKHRQEFESYLIKPQDKNSPKDWKGFEKQNKQPYDWESAYSKTMRHKGTGLTMKKHMEYMLELRVAEGAYQQYMKEEAWLVDLNGWELLQYYDEKRREEQRYYRGILEAEKFFRDKEFKKFNWNNELFIYKGHKLTAYQIAQAVFKVTSKKAREYQFLKLYLWRPTPTLKKAMQRLRKRHDDGEKAYIEMRYAKHRAERKRVTEKYKRWVGSDYYDILRKNEKQLKSTVGRNAEWAVKIVKKDMKNGVKKKPNLLSSVC